MQVQRNEQDWNIFTNRNEIPFVGRMWWPSRQGRDKNYATLVLDAVQAFKARRKDQAKTKCQKFNCNFPLFRTVFLYIIYALSVQNWSSIVLVLFLILSSVFRKVNLLIGLLSSTWAHFFEFAKMLQCSASELFIVCSLILQEDGSTARSICLLLQWVGKTPPGFKLLVASGSFHLVLWKGLLVLFW